MSKLSKVWPYTIGVIIGIALFCAGYFRILLGILSLRVSDPYTAHYMNGGLFYILFSLFILVAVATGISHSLTKR